MANDPCTFGTYLVTNADSTGGVHILGNTDNLPNALNLVNAAKAVGGEACLYVNHKEVQHLIALAIGAIHEAVPDVSTAAVQRHFDALPKAVKGGN